MWTTSGEIISIWIITLFGLSVGNGRRYLVTNRGSRGIRKIRPIQSWFVRFQGVLDCVTFDDALDRSRGVVGMRREGRKRLGIPREKRNFSLSSPGLPTLRNSRVSNSREFREGWGRGKLVEIVRRILEEVITMGMAFFVERRFLKTSSWGRKNCW